MNNAVSIAIFQKLLRVSMLSNKNYKTGELVNLIQVDANRLYAITN